MKNVVLLQLITSQSRAVSYLVSDCSWTDMCTLLFTVFCLLLRPFDAQSNVVSSQLYFGRSSGGKAGSGHRLKVLVLCPWTLTEQRSPYICRRWMVPHHSLFVHYLLLMRTLHLPFMEGIRSLLLIPFDSQRAFKTKVNMQAARGCFGRGEQCSQTQTAFHEMKVHC